MRGEVIMIQTFMLSDVGHRPAHPPSPLAILTAQPPWPRPLHPEPGFDLRLPPLTLPAGSTTHLPSAVSNRVRDLRGGVWDGV